MIKRLFLLPLVLTPLLFVFQARADVIKDEKQMRQVGDKIMEHAAKGDLDGAFSVIKPYIIIPEAEFQSVALQSRAQRGQFASRYGKSIGFEFLKEKKVGESLVQLLYIEKTEKHVFPWAFLFYKTESGWILNSFTWNDHIWQLFEQD